MKKLHKKEIVEDLVDRGIKGLERPSQVLYVVEEVIASITRAVLRGDQVSFKILGTFGSKQVKARKARNPKTGEEAFVNAHRKPTFKSSEWLKRSVKAVDGGEKIEGIIF